MMGEDPPCIGEVLDEAPTIRLVLADDHPLVLNGLETFLKNENGFQVLALSLRLSIPSGFIFSDMSNLDAFVDHQP